MFKFFKPKVKKEKTKLEITKDLWLNYETRYFLYDIHYKDPIDNCVKLFKFPYKLERNVQRTASEKNKERTPEVLVLEKSREFLIKNVAYWLGGKMGKGLIIQEPVSVKFYEIDKKEYGEYQEQDI